MAKKKATGAMVLVGKGSYSRGKEKPLRKGDSITKEQYDGLTEEHKTYFTDPKTAEKLLKRRVFVVTDGEAENDEANQE